MCAPIFKFGSVSEYLAERGEVENDLVQRSCGACLDKRRAMRGCWRGGSPSCEELRQEK